MKVIQILAELDMQNIPQRFEHTQEIWNAACYAEGTRLLAEGKLQASYAYLQRCTGYLDTDTLLDSTTEWKLCAVWQKNEHKYVFMADGTCELDGMQLMYSLDGYDIFTGTAADQLTLTHKLASITEKKLTIRDVRDGNMILTLDRISDIPWMPLPENDEE